MSDRPARLNTSLLSVFLTLAMLTAPGCSDPDVVLSVDKLVLSFTRAEFIDRETPCDAPEGNGAGEIPAGTCTEGQTDNPELHRAGRAVRKTMTVSNNSNQEYTLVAAFAGPNGSAALADAPFRLLAIGTDPEDQSNHIGDLSALPEPLSINANSDLELTIYFYGAELGVNNGRLLLSTEETATVENADGESSDVPAWSVEIVLQGTVDCVSLGWDQDMDGFCSAASILDTDPDKDCDDTAGPGHQANPGIAEEVCEMEGGELIGQVDSDCDGFVSRPIDLDQDGFCSYEASCVPEGDVDAIAELQILCGSAEDDCEDDPATNPSAPFIAPGNNEVCEIGDDLQQVDNNCVPGDDFQGMRWYLRDQDGDGFGEDPTVLDAKRNCGDPSLANVLFAQCVPTGATPTGDTLDPGACEIDCNDGIATIFPGALPICDGEDSDCDGVQDTPAPPANPPSWWDVSMNIDIDQDNDGRALCSGLDCDDTNNNVVVGAAELCDGLDNNCDQVVPLDENDDDFDTYVECAGVPPTAQLQVAGQPTEELVLFASPALDPLVALTVVVDVVAGAAEALTEDLSTLTVTLTFEPGVSTTTTLKTFVSNQILSTTSPITLLGLAIGDGEHAWTGADEVQTVNVTGTLGGDCNDDPADPAAAAVNPGASELNGAGFAICDGQDNNCDGVGHPNETDDDQDGYAECAPSQDISGDLVGGELLTLTAPAAASGDNIDLTVVDGASFSITEDVGAGSITLTYVSGTSTTTSLAADIQAALGGLTLVNAVSGAGTTSWDPAIAGAYTLVNIPGGDCNDSNPEISLAAPEICDGFDNNCDGLVPASEVDQDGDGFVVCTPNSTWQFSPGGAPAVLGAAGGNDCEDDISSEPNASNIYPGAPELADSYYDATLGAYVLVDNQCPGDAGYDANGIANPGEYCSNALISPSTCLGGPSTTCYSCIAGELDNDGDTYSPALGDCDDTNDQVNSQMLEVCDGFDNDCDGSIPAGEVDDDGDGYIVCTIAPGVSAAAGIVGGSDCDDANAMMNPGQAEIADGIDNDCNALTTVPEEEDDDGDGVSELEGDCDDESSTVWEDTAAGTSAPEICDELDNDCDGLLSDGVGGTIDEVDDDGDGFTVCDPSLPTSTTLVNDCLEHASQITAAIAGYPAFGADNYPANAAAVHPGAVEVCDGWDTDCSSGSFLTSASNEPTEFDNDGDDFIDCLDTGEGVVGFTAYFAQANRTYLGANDCADIALDTATTGSPSGTGLPLTDIYPGAPELCDGWDNPCTATLPPFVNANTDESDEDGDRYLECSAVAISTGARNANNQLITGGFDCLDDPSTEPELSGGAHPVTGQAVTSAMAASVNPGESEACDGWNTDCDAGGLTQAVLPVSSDIPGEIDDDADTYLECSSFASATGVPGYAGEDCLDETLASNAYSDNVNPAATETCDSWDTDCSNQPAFPANDGLPELAQEIDDDGDLYIQCDFSAAALAGGAATNGYGGVTSGSDCLDVTLASNSYSDDVNPAATEVCDSWDTDCDSQPAYPGNDGEPEAAEELDDDGDGYVQCTYTGSASGATNNGFGGAVGDDDCLDVTVASNPYSDDVNTAATEVCDGWDTDCGSQSNYPANTGLPSGSEVDELDQDGDGYIQCAMVTAAQGNGPNGEIGGNDCLDVTLASNSYSDNVNPAATEVCDGWDTDCANQPAYPGNDGTPNDPDELDDDSDGYIPCDMVVGAAGNGPNGESGSDCLDLASNTYSGNVNPGATEVCDGWDTDCSTQSAYPGNVGTPSDPDELDQDSDGYIQCDMVAGASGNGPSGVQGSDCLDVALVSNAWSNDVNPGASSDVCDGWDTDCDSQAAYPGNDGTPENADELDQDGDTYIQCDMVAGSAGLAPNGENGSDCLDVALASNSYSDDVNPGETVDVCDGWDTDCNTQPAYPGNDGTPSNVDELDDDNDGYIPCDMVTGAATNGPNGESGSDCLDVASNSYSDNVNPGASEVCDGWDTNCSTQPAYPANLGAPDVTNEEDDDGDAYIECVMVAGASGNAPNGEQGSDCLDVALTSNPYSDDVNPGETVDVCDGWDTDCDNGTSGTPEDADELDQDSDGYIQCDMVAASVGNGPLGESGSDCLDSSTNAYSSSVNPGIATDVCDGWDTDCDSQAAYPANTGAPEDTDEQDQDGDNYVECTGYVTTSGAANITDGDDCLDAVTGLTYPLDTAADPAITLAQAAEVNPGASEVCDGFNTDCAGGSGSAAYLPPSFGSNESDFDNDDFMACGPSESWTPTGLGASDCLDTDIDVNPGEPSDPAGAENLVDNDCDGIFDEDAAAGSIAVTELMVSTTGGDSQWFEIYNESGRAVSLHQWAFDTSSGASFSFTGTSTGPTDAPLQIAAGAYEVLCVDPSNGTDATSSPAKGCFNTAAMTGFTMNASSDTVTLAVAGSTIDTLSWSSALGTNNGASATLDPLTTPFITANNTVDLTTPGWCEPLVGWNGGTGGRLGSPGYENVSCDSLLIDVDGDGYCAGGQDTTGDGDCNDPSETAASNPTDCDETNATINEAATEICDGWDTDCSSGVSFPPDVANEADDDGDNYIECTVSGSPAMPGTIVSGDDCDDVRAYKNPGEGEVCDGYDNDCSGTADFSDGGGDELDGDGDDYVECTAFSDNDGGAGFLGGSDCDDVRAYRFPTNPEVCDGYDNDCTGGVDGTDEVDVDNDDYFLCTGFVDRSGADAFEGGSDCDDTRAYMNGGEVEICDGYDNDCAGGASFADGGGDELDADSDDYVECTAFSDSDGAGGFTGGSDCNDAAATTYPGAPELCDAADNDCNTLVDDNLDGDGDGVTTCGPDGTPGNTDDDCDDGNSAIFPGATEICDGFDSNCTGGGSPLPPDAANEADDDGDGYIECDTTGVVTLATGVTAGDDCRDVASGTDAYSDDINPGASELCDGFDTDCSSGNYLTAPANETDTDTDGYVGCSSYVGTSTSGLTGGDDCREVALGTDAYSDDINPGASEVCDGFDTDCSTGTYTNAPTNETDTDTDGYVICSSYVGTSTSGLTGGDDCREVALGTDAYSDDINPGASEACDGFDTDCSTGTYTNAPSDETDTDADGYVSCTSYVGTSTSGLTGGDDCREAALGTDAYSDDINPGATEVCDGFDTDCSTGTYTNAPSDETDGDSDGYVTCAPYVTTSTSSLTGGDDCDDAVGTTFPFAGDSAVDGTDADCDGLDCVAGDGTAGTAYSSGPYYVYCATSGDQSAAVTACEVTVDNSTMRLAEVANSTDNGEIAALMGSGDTAWLGATDTVADGTHVWDAGTENTDGATTYSNFTSAPTVDTFVQGATIDDTGAWAEALVAATPTGYVCELP